MGFPCVSITMPKSSEALTFLVLNLVRHLKLMVMAAFSGVGVFNQSADQELGASSTPVDNYVMVMDRLSPMPVPVPIHVLTASIKKTLPVSEYRAFLARFEGPARDQKDVVVMGCPICLECVEGSHEIRELPNCFHVFHRECLDHWVDQDQVTCPLCRSMLFSSATRIFHG